MNVGLTGGIGAGKSTVARLLAQLGAVVVDSDVLAREVVEPGTDGLAAVIDAFGPEVLDSEGAMDRAAVAQHVFSDESARRRLEEIIHPRVRVRAAELTAQAPGDAIVVQDVPLLAEVGLAPTFDLVLVITADFEVRLDRLAERGLDRSEASARIRAQAPDSVRLAVADAVIDNSHAVEATEGALATLWRDRLVPFEDHKRRRAVVRPTGPVEIVPYESQWAARFERLAARLRYLLGEDALRIDHIGSTSVPGLVAKDIIDVQVSVADLTVADEFADRLAESGFPYVNVGHDSPKPFAPDPSEWDKRLHGGTDPANRCHIHIRRDGSPGWYVALAMREFLRRHPAARNEYAELKRRLADSTDSQKDYAVLKEPWFDQVWPRIETWARDVEFDGRRPTV